jgi:hypothetical protein
MAKRKNTLSLTQNYQVSLIGISCHMKSYRLSFNINKALNFSLRRIDDFEIPLNSGQEMLCFPFLSFDDENLKNHFCLISNHHPQGKLIPSMRQVDYFLIAKNPVDKFTRQKILQSLRNIAQVVAAYEINPNKSKDLDQLIEEMELHLMISQKKKPSSQA